MHEKKKNSKGHLLGSVGVKRFRTVALIAAICDYLHTEFSDARPETELVMR